jgi:hypothetical protein
VSTALSALIVGTLHALYICLGYGTKVFGLQLPDPAAITVWLLLPSALAAYCYWKVSGRIPGFSAKPVIRSICVLVWLSTSTYAGFFVALNRYGS